MFLVLNFLPPSFWYLKMQNVVLNTPALLGFVNRDQIIQMLIKVFRAMKKFCNHSFVLSKEQKVIKQRYIYMRYILAAFQKWLPKASLHVTFCFSIGLN